MVASVVCGFLAGGQRRAPSRRQLWFAATALFGLVFVVLAVANYLRPQTPQLFDADGVIVRSTPYGGGTEIQVQIEGGGIAHVHASGRSKFFRVGEHIKARYEAYSGSIRDAQFFTADGKPEGDFHTPTHQPSVVLGSLGLVIVGLGWFNSWRMQQRQLFV